MGLNTWFDKGITSDAYIESLEKYEESFSHIYKNFTVPADENFLQAIRDKKLRIVVLAEPWCGHCLLTIPVLLRFAEKVNMPVRILPRDENLELMDHYLTNGKSRTIPIFIFIDENGDEVTKWGPIAENTKQFVDQFKNELPPKDAADFKEKFTQMVEFMAKEFRDKPDFWSGSYISIKEKLAETL